MIVLGFILISLVIRVGSEASDGPGLGRTSPLLDTGVVAWSSPDEVDRRQALSSQSQGAWQPWRFPWKLPAEMEADRLKRRPLARAGSRPAALPRVPQRILVFSTVMTVLGRLAVFRANDATGGMRTPWT